METAKQGVKDFLHKHGKHDTSVHENFAPAVTNETVNKHQHDNVVTALDREVHQDHYHTSVQPVHDSKTLPEQHHYNTIPVEHRKFEHGNDAEVEQRLRAEREKFKDTSVKGETRHTDHKAEPIVGEHIHHHVHENIQPVVNRQTVEPHVVHTTVPIHEVHHSAAQHHASNALPAMSMADFKKQGGALGGREQRSDFYEGEPRSMEGHTPHRPDASSEFRNTGHVTRHPHDNSQGSALAGGAAAGAGAGATALNGASHNGTGLTGSSDLTRRGHTGARRGSSSSSSSSDYEGRKTSKLPGVGGTRVTNGTSSAGGSVPTQGTSASTTGATKKPSLIDRLNPMKDTDGDGKKGIMD